MNDEPPIEDLWAGRSVHRWPDAGALLDGNAATLLRDVGAPPSPTHFIELVAPLRRLDADYVEFASDGGAPLCIHRPSGRVFAVERELVRPMNSSVEAALRHFARMARYAADVRGLPEEEAARVVEESIARMQRIDPAAWSDADAYWPCVGAQMREGNL